MKLSEQNPDDVTLIEPAKPGPAQGAGKLRLSDLHPSEVSHVGSAGEPGTLEAVARGALQGATLGFGDELYGAGAAGVGALQKGSLSDVVSDYIRSRNEVRANNERARAAHPYAYGGSEFLGGIAPAAATGGTLPALAATGAAGAIGTSNASDPATLATQGAIGSAGAAAAGAAFNAAAPYVKKGLSNVGEYIAGKLGRGAEDLATAHLQPTAAMTRNLGKEGVRATAREALDTGAIEPFSKVGRTAENLSNRLEEVGAVKGDLVNQSTASINPADIVQDVQSRVVNPLRASSETEPIANTIEGKAQALMQKYSKPAIGPNGEINVGPSSMTPAQLEAEKMAVQNNITYGANSGAQTGAAQDYARVLKEGVENAVTDPAFKAAKDTYGKLTSAQEMADRAASLQNGGLMSHITDVGLGTAAVGGLAHGNPLPALGFGARVLSKGRLASTGAMALDKSSAAVRSLMQSNIFTEAQLSKIAASPYFQRLQTAALAGGPDSVSTTHYVLQQTDPGYQKLLHEEQQ